MMPYSGFPFIRPSDEWNVALSALTATRRKPKILLTVENNRPTLLIGAWDG
ncbi:hypothetical protein JHU38_01405 [Prevotella sp. A2931]|uniref:Uncharacterized protein n=1 Tax=Prevotella illustrans TaxID=2800387 RepID=A0ABS3M2T9_9BACT|nr:MULTISPECIES: hypothetical protein [Prevotella]MBO1362451.1 hypothetical protein [Prevotella illustrans]